MAADVQRTLMHPNDVDLYAGLYGLILVPDTFDLGHGTVISRTYAHFMAPFMMAFAPAAPGKHHPGPADHDMRASRESKPSMTAAPRPRTELVKKT